MAFRLYLDDCAFKRSLRERMAANGHTIVIPRDASPDLTGADDDVHLDYTAKTGLVLFTKSPKDFLELHKSYLAVGRSHAGIIVIYQDNDVSKDMSDSDIIHALVNVETVHGGSTGLQNEAITLNHYRW